MNFDSFSNIFDRVTPMKNNELWLIFDIFDRVSLVKNGLLVGTRDHDKNITVAPKERIFLQRKPENTYDENAIAAKKQSGILFGHGIGSSARKLSSILSVEDTVKFRTCDTLIFHSVKICKIWLYLFFIIFTMRLLFNLFSIFALASCPAIRPLLAVSSGIGVTKRSQILDDMCYRMYALRDRYSMDQVHMCRTLLYFTRFYFKWCSWEIQMYCH